MIERFALDLAGERLSVVALTVAGLITLDLLVIAAVAFFAMTALSVLVVLLYREACAAVGVESDDATGDEQATGAALRSGVWRKRVLYTGAVVFLLIATGLAYTIVDVLGDDRVIGVTAHRGSSQAAPENTRRAFELAIEEGADFIELDVQETADGQIVVLHDADLMRMAGVDKRIWESTYDEVKDLDIGSSFDPQFSDQRLLLLEDAIELARDRIGLNIELKFNGHDEDLVRRVVDIIRAKKFESQCFLTSLDNDGLVQAKAIAPDLRTGLIIFESLGDVSKLDVEVLSVNADNLQDDLVRKAHAAGMEVHVWTVNDPAQMGRLIDRGVDNILTDTPAEAVALRAERAQLSDVERVMLVLRHLMDQRKR